MGLDATVFRNPKNLPERLRERVTVTSPDSGEIDFRNAADDQTFGSSKLEVWHERIGNIGTVAFLREEIARAFGNQESLLSKKVVYSGSHTGDHIPFSQIDLLSREIEQFGKDNQCLLPSRAGEFH